MHRSKLISLLNKYSPTTEEKEFKARILSFVETNPNCFARSLLEGHITGSAWLCNYENTKALLLHHAKLDIWVQPGGHADGEPDILQVALKEAMEETGLEDITPINEDIFDIDVHLIAANSKEKAHYHYDIRFLLKIANPTKEVKINSESKSFMWVEKNDRKTLLTNERSVLRMWEKWQQTI